MIWNNRYLDAAVLGSSGAATGYPLTCVQDPFRSRRWRSATISGEYISVDFGASINFNTVVLVDHNLTFAGTIRITASDSPGGSDLLDETYGAWPPVIGYGEGYFGGGGFGGSILEADRAWAIPNPIRIIYIVDGNGDQLLITARYVAIEFIDAGNLDGHIELGRLFVTQYADVGIQFQNIKHIIVDESEVNRSLGGQGWWKEVPLRRVIELTFNVIDYLDKYWNLKFAIEKMGITKNFIMDCFPDPEVLPSQSHHSILYGHFQNVPELEQNYDMGFIEGRQVSTLTLTFEEEVV